LQESWAGQAGADLSRPLSLSWRVAGENELILSFYKSGASQQRYHCMGPKAC
jgi:hypothetical protein